MPASGRDDALKAIKIRQIALDFSAIKERHWFGGNPYLTHLLTAIFQVFPDGEPFTVHAIRPFMAAITDPVLRDAVRNFIIQESNHGKVHDDFFVWLDVNRVSSAATRTGITAAVEAVKNRFATRPLRLLSATVAAEHFAAVVGAAVLARPDFTSNLDPTVRALTYWHAIEEIEHRSVAFDVYASVGGSRRQRALDLIVATPLFCVGILLRMLALARADGELFNVKAAFGMLRFLFGRKGFFRQIMPMYTDFFRRDFHPAQHQCAQLLADGTRTLEQLATVKTLAGRRRDSSVAS